MFIINKKESIFLSKLSFKNIQILTEKQSHLIPLEKELQLRQFPLSNENVSVFIITL